MAYTCDNEDGAGADVLITRLADGDTTALCGPCFLQLCGMLAQDQPHTADSAAGGGTSGPVQGAGPDVPADAPDAAGTGDGPMVPEAGTDIPPPPRPKRARASR